MANNTSNTQGRKRLRADLGRLERSLKDLIRTFRALTARAKRVREESVRLQDVKKADEMQKRISAF
ncbi:hypothetical protein EDM68_04465 [Candidatus Uhrbacteria bacterium]|nr:MAG: hypothetical protein EDM68_04465 [Candidatus Uhrbacteria bacterium]